MNPNEQWTHDGKQLSLQEKDDLGVGYQCYNGCYFSEVDGCPKSENDTLICDKNISKVWKEVKFQNPTKVDIDSNKGIKFDSDKRQWWYLWQFLPEVEQLVDILQYGGEKYPAEDGSNWRRVEGANKRYTSALMRHLSAYLQGEKVDPESGKSHLAHMITNALFLMWFDRNEKE